MRVLLGLAALAAAVNGQTVTPNGNQLGNFAQTNVPVGQTALTSIEVRRFPDNLLATVNPSIASPPTMINSLNWVVTVPNSVTGIDFNFVTNIYTGQMQYRWGPNYPNLVAQYGNAYGLSAQSYICDPCAGGTAISCNSAVGPGGSILNVATPVTGYRCASLSRQYRFTNLVASLQNQAIVNSFSMQLFDLVTNPAPNTSSYSFQIVRAAPILIVGDPQIIGMQGQDFQVHGMPDEIFNIVTSPSLQVNARFTYLESGECHDNFTACFAHPGTYISEEGLRLGKDKVRVAAGSFKKGLTVSVNGKKVKENLSLKHGAIELVSHRRVVVHTDLMKISISNSDHFLNQELELNDDKLITLGAKRLTLKDNERFHAEVPLHGLQGQTWRNVEYASGLEYEGSIMDYHVVDGNLFGTDFVFNQFKA